MSLLLTLILSLTAIDFLDYRWEWNDPTWEQAWGQSRHLAHCISRPGVVARCGCLGRFDMDGNGDVDAADVDAFNRWVSGLLNL